MWSKLCVIIIKKIKQGFVTNEKISSGDYVLLKFKKLSRGSFQMSKFHVEQIMCYVKLKN